MKHNLAISLALPMKRDPGPPEDQRRPTAVDEKDWRLAQRRAALLGLEWKPFLEEVTGSRSTAWRSDTQGATPKILRSVEAKLTELEARQGSESRGALFEEWKELGMDLLLADEDGHTFRRMMDNVRQVLDATRKLQSAMSALKQPTPDPQK